MQEKGAGKMKIAVTYENGEIYQHFGHCQVFKTYTVEDGNITETKEEPVNGSGHSALAGFLLSDHKRSISSFCVISLPR